MSTETAGSAVSPAKATAQAALKENLRDYGLVLALIAIMVFFQFTTNGTLFKPVNLTNLVLQNSYIVIMALGMLLIIVAGHIDLSVGSVSGFIGAGLTGAGVWLAASGARDLFIGVNALDYSGYPDCRPDFVAEFQKLANLATKAGVEGEPFTIHAPLQDMTKADIAREAERLGLDSSLSHSCYDPAPDGRHCGQCDACRLRAKGFAEAGIADPTAYA